MESDYKNSSKPSLFVDSITFNSGETIPLKHDDIVVFVGPNNAGKSQSLRDIYSFLGNEPPFTVITNVQANLYGNVNVTSWLDSFSKFMHGSSAYVGLNFVLQHFFIVNNKFLANLPALRNLFTKLLNTEERLSITNPASLISEEQAPNHPIQRIKNHPDLRIRLSKYVFQAFGVHLTPGFDSPSIPLYIGDEIKLDGEFRDEQARLEAYRKRLMENPVLHKQGDGMRSFAGILLNLLVPHYSCFLIDEPESFLHPPQAKKLGEILINSVPENTQVFIATHGQDFLSGLLSKSANRLKIIRITRDGNLNRIHLLSNQTISSLVNDSFLYYSGIFNSLFHESVVVCESESDCRLYSLILNDIKKENQEPNNTLFLHCGGKHRLPTIAKTLRSMNIKFKVIVDIDILDDTALVEKLYTECGGSVDSEFKKYNKQIRAGVQSLSKTISLKELKEKLEDKLRKFEYQKQLSTSDLEELRKTIRLEKPWDQIKRCGFEGFPRGDCRAAANRVNKILKEVGIFVVPVGELEGFAKEIPGHGPRWVETLLETYPRLSEEIYDDVKSFIRELQL